MNEAISPPHVARREWLGLAVAFVCCFSVAGLGGYLTGRGLGPWFESLRKPSLNPPNTVFGPVWSLLYSFMAVSGWLVWLRGPSRPARVALAWFGVQLVLNLLWTGLFFALRLTGVAFVEIIFLWLAILVTILSFSKVSKPAAYLLIPYILWVTFASYLNFMIWRLNS